MEKIREGSRIRYCWPTTHGSGVRRFHERQKGLTVIENGRITTRELAAHLGRCGYSGNLLRGPYVYSDAHGEEKRITLAGFARGAQDVRSACVAAIDQELLAAQEFPELVQKHRDLGAPVIFICCHSQLQWWGFKNGQPVANKRVSVEELPAFFEKYRSEFAPERIYRAKTRGRLQSDEQLAFVDIGLIPVIEEETGGLVSRIMQRTLGVLGETLAPRETDVSANKWMFQAAFWLLGAKILHDKSVKGFSNLDYNDVDDVLRRVNQHYNAEEGLECRTRKQKDALRQAGGKIAEVSSLANLTVEALAYVYEKTLVTDALRKALGIHATPSYLVDYIVWQLAPWIEEIPEDKRIVFEPTCGHAPFLTSATRMLREMFSGVQKNTHDYLRRHLVGIEMDGFAREIARLSLTLADVPNPNGWDLMQGDVYQGNILCETARNSTILLCNPPFQDFTPKEQTLYKNRGVELKCYNKAAEILLRTLPFMASGSVFGVILPQGALHKANLSLLRKMVVEEFELSEICALPENVFSSAKHPSTVLLGRKRVSAKKAISVGSKVRFRRIRRGELDRFRESYRSSTEEISQERLNTPPNYDFRLQQLYEVWNYCASFPRLKDVADVGKGLEYKSICPRGEKYDSNKHLPPNALTASDRKFPGAVRGYAKFERGIRLTESPQLIWMNLDTSVIRRPGLGAQGVRQVLLNYARVSYGPWRLKALIDHEGRPAISRFLIIRPREEDWELEILWAVLNSPFANAYAYCHCVERDNLTSTIRHIPLPTHDASTYGHLKHLVADYFGLHKVNDEVLRNDVSVQEAKRRMLAIDAEVMRLYDMPPRLERQVLDLLGGWERKGLDFKLDRYFPADFESWIPLHEYLSEQYQRSTPSFVNSWVKKNRSRGVINAFKNAAESFED